MTYAILPEDPSVEAAVRRIVREEAEGALRAVGDPGELGPRVHAMRKSVKKLRGLLRLVRPVLPDAKAENAVLRDAGRHLSELRDAAVQLSTVRRLSEGMEPAHRAALIAPFEAAAAQQDARADDATLPAFAKAMSGFLDRSQAWTLKRDDWKAIEPGLTATWDAARAALRAVRHDDAEALHEWRKRVKDHWYQARLLRPIWPPLMDPHVAAANELGEILGQVNDLAVLRERLEAAPLDPPVRHEARDRADLLHAELLARALPLGRRLLAEKSDALAARWRKWWALWDETGAG
jgi:CHAD domain-containing protein